MSIAKAIEAFTAKFADSIIATLTCFDRVMFKGYLPFSDDAHLNAFVDRVVGIPRKDFIPQLDRMSDTLVEHAQAMAEAAGAPYQYIQGKHRKEDIVDKIAQERRHPEGLLAVLCCLETCRSIKQRGGQGKPVLVFSPRQHRVLYFYFLDPEFGRMSIRIQTWFPFTVQVYVNGHEWLARQMLRRRVGFVQRDNAFTDLDNPRKAQQIADGFPGLRWQQHLERWAKLVNPLLKQTPWLAGMEHYWVIDQAELSTDVIFRSREALHPLFQRLVNYAIVTFSARDIFTFLGRRWHPNFQGEVGTDYKDRWPGARVKHRVKSNWLKMYDKFGQILRVETVINQPQEFKVRRRRRRGGERKMVWCPMNKGIANFYQYAAQATAANARYLEALSVVADPGPAYQEVEKLVQSRRIGERSYAGFNPARKDDVRLFQAVLQGEHHLHGFRNADIRDLYFGPTCLPEERRRQSAAIGRKLKRLHVRGLLRKTPHSRRWYVTAIGQSFLSAIVRLYYHGLAAAA